MFHLIFMCLVVSHIILFYSVYSSLLPLPSTSVDGGINKGWLSFLLHAFSLFCLCFVRLLCFWFFPMQFCFVQSIPPPPPPPSTWSMEVSIKVRCCFLCMCCLCFGFAYFIVVFWLFSHAYLLYSVYSSSSASSIYRWMEESVKVRCCFFCMGCLCFGFVSFDSFFLVVSHAIVLYSSSFFIFQPFFQLWVNL